MKQRSVAIDYIKALSILSVICAHCNGLLNSTSVFANKCSLFLQSAGTFGVICFMVISGYLFRAPTKNAAAFFSKKLKTIVIPWIISATCVWLYVYLRQPPLTLISWARFVIGDGSYLYYLTVLMLFYCVFAFLPFMRKKAALVVCEAVTAVSCLWFSELLPISPYLNPLNWIGFFALGIHLANREPKDMRKGRVLLFGSVTWVLCISLMAFQVLKGINGYYFGGLRAITSWVGAASVALLGIQLAKGKKCKLLGSIGENSLFIYLWHMPVAGIVANIFSRGALQYFTLLRPVIVLGIVFLANQFAHVLFSKLKISKLGFLIGIGR